MCVQAHGKRLEANQRSEIIRWQPPKYVRLLKNVKNTFKQFQLSRIATRFVQEREKKGSTLGITQQGGENCRSPHAPSYEQLGCGAKIIEANMEFERKKAWDLHKNINKVLGTCVQT